MNRALAISMVMLPPALLFSWACAQQPAGPTYAAAPCKVAPRIDGVAGAEEWTSATRVELELQMRSGKHEPRPARKVELRFMNSDSHLYVALRVPDAARDLSTSPSVIADLALLAFCRGREVSAGDDRRVLLPGLFADKHFVSPGKDADDPQRDGQGAMVWQKSKAGGQYFAEWQVPLNSGDKNDISATPGDRLRFNLVYIDRFNFTLTDTELGGIFGADTDHVRSWGSLELAKNVGPEAPAPPPAWLAKLFPHTEAPGRLQHRLRRVDAAELPVGTQTGGAVIVELKYPGLDGKDTPGKARIFLPPVLRSEPSRKVPLVHVAGYEANEAMAAGLLAQGYAVSTPHAHPLNPLGRGVHLDRAILHAVTDLPCIDSRRVGIQGGSAGGWMTLMLAADAFPLMWAMPDVPPVHWGYNAAYFAENQKYAAAGPGAKEPRLPVLAAVGGIADQTRNLYGVPFESPAYLAVSPLAHLDTLTAPTLTVFTTADLLVPIDQVSPKLVRPHDPGLFPAGFSLAMTHQFPGVNGRRTLLEALPPDRYELFSVPFDPQLARAGAAGKPKSLSLAFSRERAWSIVVLDEGAPEPAVGHFKYQWSLDHEPFRKWAESRGVSPDQLTTPKLERLMKRLRGEPWRPLKVRPGGQGEEMAGNLLDYPEAERRDVVRSLQAFAQDDVCAVRLAQLYGKLPAGLQAFGARLGDGSAGGVRSALATAAARGVD